MKIQLEISEENESTSYPWWVIIVPTWTTKGIISDVDICHHIEGPFFSRQEAQTELGSRRHFYGKRAAVYCLSGYCSGQYRRAIDDAEKVGRNELHKM